MINAVSTVNTSFRGHKDTTLPITQKHINVVNDAINSEIIKELDNLGLINRPMLKKIKKTIALRDAQISAKSVDTIFDIIKHPRFMIEQKDNGYWFETESRYNSADTVLNYANGKRYSTPIFSREREFASALDTVAKKGNAEDFKRLEKLMKQMTSAKPILDHVETLRKINHTTKLHFCIPQQGKLGKLIPLDRQNAFQFVSDSLLAPLKTLFETATRKLPKAI